MLLLILKILRKTKKKVRRGGGGGWKFWKSKQPKGSSHAPDSTRRYTPAPDSTRRNTPVPDSTRKNTAVHASIRRNTPVPELATLPRQKTSVVANELATLPRRESDFSVPPLRYTGILSPSEQQKAIETRVKEQQKQRNNAQTRHNENVTKKIHENPAILTKSNQELSQQEKWYKNRFQSLTRKQSAAASRDANKIFRQTGYQNLSKKEKKEYNKNRAYELLKKQYDETIIHEEEFHPRSFNSTKIAPFDRSTIPSDKKTIKKLIKSFN